MSRFRCVLLVTETSLLLSVRTDNDPPADSISEQINPRVISGGLLVLMTVLAALGIVLSCIFLVFNIRYRHCKYVLHLQQLQSL